MNTKLEAWKSQTFAAQEADARHARICSSLRVRAERAEQQLAVQLAANAELRTVAGAIQRNLDVQRAAKEQAEQALGRAEAQLAAQLAANAEWRQCFANADKDAALAEAEAIDLRGRLERLVVAAQGAKSLIAHLMAYVDGPDEDECDERYAQLSQALRAEAKESAATVPPAEPLRPEELEAEVDWDAMREAQLGEMGLVRASSVTSPPSLVCSDCGHIHPGPCDPTVNWPKPFLAHGPVGLRAAPAPMTREEVIRRLRARLGPEAEVSFYKDTRLDGTTRWGVTVQGLPDSPAVLMLLNLFESEEDARRHAVAAIEAGWPLTKEEGKR